MLGSRSAAVRSLVHRRQELRSHSGVLRGRHPGQETAVLSGRGGGDGWKGKAALLATALFVFFCVIPVFVGGGLNSVFRFVYFFLLVSVCYFVRVWCVSFRVVSFFVFCLY